jgi:hypothetical protein
MAIIVAFRRPEPVKIMVQLQAWGVNMLVLVLGS